MIPCFRRPLAASCLFDRIFQSYGPVLVTGGGDSAVIIWEVRTDRRFSGTNLCPAASVLCCPRQSLPFAGLPHRASTTLCASRRFRLVVCHVSLEIHGRPFAAAKSNNRERSARFGWRVSQTPAEACSRRCSSARTKKQKKLKVGFCRRPLIDPARDRALLGEARDRGWLGHQPGGSRASRGVSAGVCAARHHCQRWQRRAIVWVLWCSNRCWV